MNKFKFMQYLPWGLAIFIAVIFVQSLFFKFTNSFETQLIFGTIGDWMGDIGFLQFAAAGFTAYGGYVVGTVELIASILLLIPRTRALGATLALAVISGAIFFHLFTPLGVNIIIDEAGNRDGGQLFAMAVLIFFSSLVIMWLGRDSLASLFGANADVHEKVLL